MGTLTGECVTGSLNMHVWSDPGGDSLRCMFHWTKRDAGQEVVQMEREAWFGEPRPQLRLKYIVIAIG